MEKSMLNEREMELLKAISDLKNFVGDGMGYISRCQYAMESLFKEVERIYGVGDEK